MKEMRIACWTKAVYTDDPRMNDFLRGHDLPPGKRILRFENEMHEIDVVAPNVDESEFCPYNVCPVGTINVEEACLENAETREPKEYISRRAIGRRPKTPHERDSQGQLIYENYEIIEKKHCPEGFVPGERTDKINWLGSKKPLGTAGIVADAMDENLEAMEPRASKGAKLELTTSLTCVKIQPMPMEKKWIEMITDSIIGWGGYAEFPFWDLNWDLMNDIAGKRSRWNGDYMEHSAEIAEGYRVCWSGYNEYPCACFKTKEDANFFKKSIEYYEYSSEFMKDAEEQLKEKKKDGEFDGEINEQTIQEQMDIERQFFFDDLPDQFESYLGMGEKSYREEPVQYVGKYQKKKWKESIVLVTEDMRA